MSQPQGRRDERVDTALLVFLDNARGVTRDMSASGAYFWTSGNFTPGESINFAIEVKTADGKMMWKCKGDIVRAEPFAHMVGVATRITESRMESAQT